MSLPLGFRELKAYQLSYELAMEVFRESKLSTRRKGFADGPNSSRVGGRSVSMFDCFLPSAFCRLPPVYPEAHCSLAHD